MKTCQSWNLKIQIDRQNYLFLLLSLPAVYSIHILFKLKPDEIQLYYILKSFITLAKSLYISSAIPCCLYAKLNTKAVGLVDISRCFSNLKIVSVVGKDDWFKEWNLFLTVILCWKTWFMLACMSPFLVAKQLKKLLMSVRRLFVLPRQLAISQLCPW